jgi:hypothetical protein
MTDSITQDKAFQSNLQRLIDEDAIGQLRRRDGRMAALGSEDNVLKLDWVEGVARLLADPTRLEQVEAEARAIWQRGIRHIIWAGMGGSVLTVQVMRALGFCGVRDAQGSPKQSDTPLATYPLDSTDPAALNEIVREIASAKQLTLPPAPEGAPAQPTFLRALLHDVLMVGVAMGMTSEEPITHLEWFTDLLKQAQLIPAEHLLVMTLPGSYLDRFAHVQQAPILSLQPDGGTGTGGRMSAPSTRVFLLPAAWYLLRFGDASGKLRTVLQTAWSEYDFELAATNPAQHPFVQLASALSAASHNGVCRVLLSLPEGWHSLTSWIEQLMEESLGKGGKGIVVFDDQVLSAAAPTYRQEGLLRVRVVTVPTQPKQEQSVILLQPSLASQDPQRRLAALAASFLGWQLSMALYGYLQDIPFAGQPAVEQYKTRARALRTQTDPLQVVSHWQPAAHAGILTLLAPPGAAAPKDSAATGLAPLCIDALRRAASGDSAPGSSQVSHLGYLDVTINGKAPARLLKEISKRACVIANARLGIPMKLRVAPAAYHSTEQSEMDGPSGTASLRLVARESEPCRLGRYTTTFLHAQAVSTWQSMLEQGRLCLLLVIDGSLDGAAEPLAAFFTQVEKELSLRPWPGP